MPMARGATYVKAVFQTPAGLADEAAGMLVACGALGCAVERGGRAGARSHKPVKLEAYFSKLKPERLRAIRRAMGTAGMLAKSDRETTGERIVDPGWATMWQRRFEPLSIGERLIVVPPWRHPKTPGRLAIVVRPGRAFGTGHHATTAGALRAIESLLGERKAARALDVGTGSGILAIAMALLGAKKIVAIDVDAEALANARENAALNHLHRRIRFATTPAAKVIGKFDLVTANILSSVLIAIAPDLIRLLARGGRLVLGGILRREVRAVMAHYTGKLRLLSTDYDHGWATMVFAR
jgi:ribosomal protein L11 methyltransferase